MTPEQMALAEALFWWYKKVQRRHRARAEELVLEHVQRDYKLIEGLYAC